MKHTNIMPLYELDVPGKYFDVEHFNDFTMITCFLKVNEKDQYRPIQALLPPVTKPYHLNDIFTKLRLGQRVFRYGR